jgi:pimeloyl-ACP methyl ester carboxylesterase
LTTTAVATARAKALAIAVLALALVAGLVAASAADAAKKPPRGPSGKAFYDPPKKFPKKHGKLIWQRKAKGLTVVDGAKSNTLVLYTSKTNRGKKTAVSGVVSVPKGKAPKRGWPVITYAHGTTGVADVCAPTRVPPKSPQAPYVTYVDPEVQDWVQAGYAVVRTDYTGLGTPGPHGYLVGQDEGRSVLDIVAAARQLNPKIGKRFLIAGHSQGGHAALFAAGYAAKWAKDLKLRGTVAYAPASHLKQQAQLLPSLTQPSPLTALATMIVDGAGVGSQAVSPQQILSDEVLALYPQLEQTCLPQLGGSNSLGGIAPSDMLRPGADLQPLYSQLDAENPAVKSDAPIALYQGTADTTVIPTFTNMLNDELVALGNDVTYQRFPGVNHAGIPAAAEDAALGFFENRLPSR